MRSLPQFRAGSAARVAAAVFGLMLGLFCVSSQAIAQAERKAQQTDLIGQGDNPNSLARFAPAKELVVWIECSGFDQHRPGWVKTNAYKMLNQTTLGAMFEDLIAEVADQSSRLPIQGTDLVATIKFALQSGFLVAINDDGGDHANPKCVTIVIRKGVKAPPAVAKLLEQLADQGGPNAKVADKPSGRKVRIAEMPNKSVMGKWNEKDDVVIVVARDESEIDRVINTLEGKEPNALESPLVKRMTEPLRGFEPVLAASVDVQKIGTLPPEAIKLGLKGVKQIDYRWGFQDDALVTVIGVDAPKPRSGLPALFDQPTFEPRNLPALPKEISSFAILSIELGKTFDRSIELAKTMHPESAAQIDQTLEMVNQMTQVDLRKDLIAHLGPKMTFAILPGKFSSTLDPWGALVSLWVQIPKAAIVIQTDDPKAVSEALAKLVAFGNQAMSGGGPGAAPGIAAEKPLKAEFRKVAGANGYTLVVPVGVLPLPNGLRPTILVGEKSVVIATNPESAKRMLEAETNPAIRWAPTGDVAKMFDKIPGKLTYLSFGDPRDSSFPELLTNIPSIVQLIGQVATSQPGRPMQPGVPPGGAAGRRFQLRTSPDLIPDPEALRKLFFPGFSVAQVDNQGFRVITRDAFPNFNPSSIGVSSGPVMIALLLPAVQAAREAARRAQCTNNLKQMALALFNFESANGAFPAAAITDKAGKPLLSWRVAMLPYIEQGALYNQFKLDEPWDSPNNIKLLASMPQVFKCPSQAGEPNMTHYRVFTGKGSGFEQPGGHKIAEYTDGTSNTLAIVEAKEGVEWTKPEGLPFENNPQFNPLELLGSKHPGGFNVAMFDGSIRFIKMSINPATLRALITRNAGEVVGQDAF